jgi:glutathione S-transferase
VYTRVATRAKKNHAMRVLYHYTFSPFSRRTRLALLHKGLQVELRECRENPSWLREVQPLVPVRTLPVLVDGSRALGDSMAITRWLDAAYPAAPRLWPDGEDAYLTSETAALVDLALDTIVNTGTRYYTLHRDPAWGAVREEMMGRAQLALDAIAERVTGLARATIAASGWSAADMWIVTAVRWLSALPARAAVSPNAAQIVTVGGWSVPKALAAWVDTHAGREQL